MSKKIVLPLVRRKPSPTGGLLKFAAPAFVMALVGKLAVRVVLAKIALKVFEDSSFRTWLKTSDDKPAANFRDAQGHLVEAPTPVLVNQISLKEILVLLAGYMASVRALRS